VLSINKDIINKLNNLGKAKTPFLVVISYDKQIVDIITNPLKSNEILFDIEGSFTPYINKSIDFEIVNTLSLQEYKEKFNQVKDQIKQGNTYLLNLTAPTIIKSNLNLEEIYYIKKAKFKLLYKDKFLCFSPERFIKIVDNAIFTYPMKGTIKASIKDAKKKLLENPKELAEHTMVVDLLRNDLSMVSKDVKVLKFRYIDEVETNKGKLYQVSSEIKGTLDPKWQENIGDILDKLLPAGSITGTPKKSTIDIIKRVENYDRGFYSGIFGYFDGKSFDSGVLIRYIEKKENKLIYKSGGGITLDSKLIDEYQELLAKVYL